MYEEYTKHLSMEVTEGIKKFVHDDVFGNSEYLFVTKENGINKGYCSKCNQEYEVENVHHNENGICPVCGASLTVKLTRYGRKNCRNEACFYYFEKSIIDTNVIVCKGYYVTKDYALDYKKPKVEYNLEAIYVFEDKKATMIKKSWGGWEVKCSIFDFNQGWLAPKMCYCSFESIEKAIQGTNFQYIPYETFQGNHSMVKLFSEYSKHPWIEQVCKIGFTDIIEAKLKGDKMYNCLNYRGKDIFKILKLSRKDVRDIKKYKRHITPLFLSLYQLQIKDNSGLSPYEVEDIEFTMHGYNNYVKIKNILKYTSMKKTFKYMEKQYKKFKKKFYCKGDIAIIWSDYIDDCTKLEMDLSSEHVLFPKDVHAAHQNTISQIKIKVNKKYDEQISKRSKTLQKYVFKYDGLLIRPALTSKELIDEANKPYFTLELKRGVIVQVHGMRNCSPTKEVEEFIKVFKEEKLTKRKSKSNLVIPA